MRINSAHAIVRTDFRSQEFTITAVVKRVILIRMLIFFNPLLCCITYSKQSTRSYSIGKPYMAPKENIT